MTTLTQQQKDEITNTIVENAAVISVLEEFHNTSAHTFKDATLSIMKVADHARTVIDLLAQENPELDSDSARKALKQIIDNMVMSHLVSFVSVASQAVQFGEVDFTEDVNKVIAESDESKLIVDTVSIQVTLKEEDK